MAVFQRQRDGAALSVGLEHGDDHLHGGSPLVDAAVGLAVFFHRGDESEIELSRMPEKKAKAQRKK